MGGPPCPSKNRLDGKIVLITGGCSGLGFETAKELAARGATLILTCRDYEKGQKAADKIKRNTRDAKIDLKLLDISEMANVRRFAMLIKKYYNRIDVLINNAGIIFQPKITTSEGFELTLATNYLGPFLLTHLLLPLLRQSSNGRIINLSSLSHMTGRIHIRDMNMERKYVQAEAFAQSKLALVMFTRHLASLLKDKGLGIGVYAVNPGIVRNTNHLKSSPFAKSLMARISTYPWIWLFLKTPKQGCQTVVFTAVEPNLSTVTGVYLSDCEIKNPSEYAKNEASSRQLYEKTCQMVQLKREETLPGLFPQD
ncbi:phosphatidylinositol-glycan biosynthesis class f protein-related [Holotrichia oblita]|uniref:Phosphatidylinositol-glycan biosynthesis class f protein-related n=1 Tax=Holotrichia oblita TaxID=644536 RepID=A0ACB9TQG2_HOLOL|nr:phosphatidylinositol-glycan biosynthesis class f protein-related [Holotrichia oblita]